MSVLTQYRVRVESPFPMIELTGFQAVQCEGEHARATFTGVLDCETGMEALYQRLEGRLVRFVDDEDDSTIFAGYIQTAEVAEQGGLFTLSATALSGSIYLDQTKRSRSYQDVTLLHSDILRMVLDDVGDADFIMRVADKPIGIPLVQYDETGWEFSKRLASHFNTTITPDMDSGIPRFWMGLRAPSGPVHDFSDCEYRAVIDKKYFEVGGSHLGFSRSQFLSYVVKDFKNRSLGDKARFRGQDLFICRKSCYLDVDCLPVYVYTLGKPELLARQKFFNEKLTGLSLMGTVIATQGGTVKLHLNIDRFQDVATAYNYRWAPPTGNYMYLMPKIGSEVSLYFCDPGEDSAMAVNCVRAESSKSAPGFADINKRNLSTEFGKNMLLYPNKFGIESKTSDGPLQMMFDDDSGVTLETAHSIMVIGGGSVTLEAPVIEMKSPTQAGLYYTAGQELNESFAPPTMLVTAQDGVSCLSDTGKTINIGHDTVTYDPYDDAPEEGQFDWGGLLSNVVAGLIVVACVVATVASFGVAGPILVAGAIAGAAAVASLGVRDYMRGNVSSTEDYMREAFIGTVVGLVTGAIGHAFTGLKAVSTIGKIGLTVAENALQGFSSSALSQLMNASMTGTLDEMNWGDFWKNVGIGTVSDIASGFVSKGISGAFGKQAGALMNEKNPFRNALLSYATVGATGYATNVTMQLANMLCFDENGNFNIDFSRVKWDNVDQASATISTISALAQHSIDRASAKRTKPPTATDENGEPRATSNKPKTPAGDDELPMARKTASDGDDDSTYAKQLKVNGDDDPLTPPKKPVEYGDQYDKAGNKKILKSNVTYTDENGYTYTTDSDGRIAHVNGELQLGDADRNAYAQRTVGGTDRLTGDDGGHLIASRFNGSGQIDNLVPQSSNINRSGGEWYRMETEWSNALKSGSNVSVDITPIYSNNSVRPDSFSVDYWIDGKLSSKTILNK